MGTEVEVAMGAASKQLLDPQGAGPAPPRGGEGEITSMVQMDLMEVICGVVIPMVPVLWLVRIVNRDRIKYMKIEEVIEVETEVLTEAEIEELTEVETEELTEALTEAEIEESTELQIEVGIEAETEELIKVEKEEAIEEETEVLCGIDLLPLSGEGIKFYFYLFY